MSKFWPATDLIGGGFGALDKIDGDLLAEGDAAIVTTPGASGIVYHYTLKADSGAAESSPAIIAPDTNPGTKRWVLVEVYLGQVNHLSLKANPSGVPTAEGTLFHDPATHMLAYKSDVLASTLNIGLEDWTRVRNETGVEIPDGTSVFGFDVIVSPDTGEETFLVVPALAVPGQVAIPGITTSAIPDDGEGFAVTRGEVKGFDTSPFTKLDFLYLSATVAGELTNVQPIPPNYAIPIGYAKDSQVDGHIYVFADNPIAIVNATDAAVSSGDPTGFHDKDNIIQDYDPVARTITLTGDLKYSYRGQVKELTSPWTSDPHPAGLDVGYFLFSTDGETFSWELTPWEFSDIQGAFVWHGTTDKFSLRETHGLMPWQAHEEFHQTVGTYRVSGGTLSNYVIDSTTAADRRPDVAAMVVKDEDLKTTNPQLISSLYAQMSLTGAGLIDFAIDEADIVPLSGNNPYFNEFVSPNWIQTLVSNNSYISVWMIGIPVSSDSDSQKYRFEWMQGQSQGSLAGQRGLNPSDLSFGNFASIFSEFIFTTKVILRYTGGNWRISEVQDLTGTSANIIGAPAGNYLSAVSVDPDSLEGDGTPTNPLSVLRYNKDIVTHTNVNSDTTIDWAVSDCHIAFLTGANVLFDFDGWQALPKSTDGTLILVDADLYPPDWETLNQGAAVPSYASGFATWLDLSSVVGGDIYNMWQVFNGQNVVLGPDVIVNGGFDTDTDWNKGPGCTISGGKCTWDGSQGAASNTRSTLAPLPALGEDCYHEFTISGYVAGNIKIALGSGNLTPATNRNQNGTFKAVTPVAGNTHVYFQADINFIGSIDVAVVKKVL